MLLTKYIAYHYFKYFIIILSALVMFLVGFDYMERVYSLPISANLMIIYVIYKALFAIDILLPISLVFAMIATKIFFIRSNALVAFYALGYSKTDVLKPFVYVATSILVIFIGLHATSFSYADEYAKNIRNTAHYIKPTTNLFFTYENRYIYFGKLNPLLKSAYDVRIFDINNQTVDAIIVAKEATFVDNYWHIKSADIMKKPQAVEFDGAGIEILKNQDLKMLDGFKPKILDQVYEGKVNFSILDAFDALNVLSEQNINTSKIKSALYKIFIYPFFVPSLIVIIFFFVPISQRFLNISIFGFIAIFSTLLIWGVLFSLIELSNSKTISPEFGIITPVSILLLIAIFQWKIDHKKG